MTRSQPTSTGQQDNAGSGVVGQGSGIQPSQDNAEKNDDQGANIQPSQDNNDGPGAAGDFDRPDMRKQHEFHQDDPALKAWVNARVKEFSNSECAKIRATTEIVPGADLVRVVVEGWQSPTAMPAAPNFEHEPADE